jgi:hypothetical protein
VLFTDIEGSTQLTEALGDEEWMRSRTSDETRISPPRASDAMRAARITDFPDLDEERLQVMLRRARSLVRERLERYVEGRRER